jgi:hypothetical protein
MPYHTLHFMYWEPSWNDKCTSNWLIQESDNATAIIERSTENDAASNSQRIQLNNSQLLTSSRVRERSCLFFSCTNDESRAADSKCGLIPGASLASDDDVEATRFPEVDAVRATAIMADCEIFDFIIFDSWFCLMFRCRPRLLSSLEIRLLDDYFFACVIPYLGNPATDRLQIGFNTYWLYYGRVYTQKWITTSLGRSTTLTNRVLNVNKMGEENLLGPSEIQRAVALRHLE